jgi:hypothetical protein
MKLTKMIGNYVAALSLIFSMTAIPLLASSHAEAPLISMDRYADNTDVYAFRSTEAGRSGFVTLIANFIPFQDPSGGPQFFRFDDTVLYEIKIDNTGDGREDIIYQFRFKTQTLNSDTVLGHNAVNQDGIISNLTDPDYNMPQTYSVTRSTRFTPPGLPNSKFNNLPNFPGFPLISSVIASGLRTPPSNVGPRSTPNYEQNLGFPAIHTLSNGGRVFAGQRDEGFFLDLGGPFDVINYRSITDTGGIDTLRTYNVSSIAIEVPISEVTRSGAVPASPNAADAVIGVWSTASRSSIPVIGQNSGQFQQISRLGNPLVNEVVVPLGLKDAFNALSPSQDFSVQPVVNAVLDPELPKLIKTALALYGTGGMAPPININIPPAPRNDIAQIFVLGIPVNPITGPNYTTVIAGNDGRAHEMLRLNLAIPARAYNAPGGSRLGLLGGDVSGFPNGRRVGDDVVDIGIRALLGGTPFTPAFNVAPNNTFGDGVSVNFEGYLDRFPYLNTPNQGNQPRPENFPSLGTTP